MASKKYYNATKMLHFYYPNQNSCITFSISAALIFMLLYNCVIKCF